MIHSVSFTNVAFEAFAKEYLCFLVSASAKKKKKCWGKFLVILKKYLSKNKMYVCLKKSNVSLNKKVIFVFHMIFKLDFVTHHLLCYPQMSVFFFDTFFVLLYHQFLRNGT